MRYQRTENIKNEKIMEILSFMARPIKMSNILKAWQFHIMLKSSTDNNLPGQFSAKKKKNQIYNHLQTFKLLHFLKFGCYNLVSMYKNKGICTISAHQHWNLKCTYLHPTL